MFYLIGGAFLCLILTGIFESQWLDDELRMRKLIRESREYEKRRNVHRNVYSEACYFPPQSKRRLSKRRC